MMQLWILSIKCQSLSLVVRNSLVFEHVACGEVLLVCSVCGSLEVIFGALDLNRFSLMQTAPAT